MQGQRSSLTTLPENLSFEHAAMSGDTGIDSQMSWSNIQTSAQNRLPDYRLSTSGTNVPYLRHIRLGGQNAQWSLGETSSAAAQNHIHGNEGKIEQHSRNFHPRAGLTMVERQYEPSNIISVENDETDLNEIQATNGSFVLQNSSSDGISQDLNMMFSGLEDDDDEDDDCRIVERPSTYASVGSSSVLGNEERPGCSLDGRRMSCKRKAFELQAGQSSGEGSSNTFQNAERSHWRPIPAAHIASSNVTLPTQTQNEPIVSNSSEHANARLRLGVGGAVSAGPFSLTSSGNPESSRRNFRVRINGSPYQDPIAAHPFATGPDIGNRDISSTRHSARLLRNNLLDLNPVPPVENGTSPHEQYTASLRRNPQTRWSRASSSRNTRSSTPAIPEPTATNIPIPRSLAEHPIFVPAATGIRSSSEHPTGWNLAGGNNPTIGNVVSASAAGSSSGVNLSGTAWSHRSRPERPRRLSEIVRRSVLLSAGSDSGGQGPNPATGSSSSLTPEEIALLSGSQMHDRAATRSRSAVLERNLDLPYSLRNLATASEGRSSIMSEQIRHVLNLMRRGEGLRFEDVMLLDHSVFLGVADMHDRHRDMRLDVDNMSYEELLALEERIGNVCTGLNDETIMKGLKQHKYVENGSKDQVDTGPCSICREEYNEGEDLGTLECGHDFHRDCIKQWLVQKNSCPICKKTGLST